MNLIPVFILCSGAILLNMPFGFYRMGVPRYSWRWFLAIHLPIPFIIAIRLGFGQGWQLVPFLFVFAVIGQLAGGLLRQGFKGTPQPMPQEVDRIAETTADEDLKITGE